MTWGLWGIGVPGPGERTAMPMIAQRTAAYGFQKGETPYAGGHRAEAFDSDTGETVGYLEHDRDSGEVSSVWVHPDHRGRGIATDLFDWTRSYVNSRLRHSDDLTDEGRAWAESMGHDTGNARTVQWPTAHRTAMPAPMPEGITFHYHPIDDTIPVQPWAADPTVQTTLFSAPAVEARHHGKTVGFLEWDPPLHSTQINGIAYGDHPPEVSMIKVHPDYRRHGIATALFDFARQHQGDLEHSDSRTGLGNRWVEYEQNRHRTAHRTAMPTYYHVAPWQNRDSILQHGLDHTRGENQWGMTPGNYFWENEDDAHEYADGMTQMARDEGGYDEDDEPGYVVLPFYHDGPVMDDPEGNHEQARGRSFYTTDPIPASAFHHPETKKARTMTAAVTVPVGSRYGLHTTPSMLISNAVKRTGWPVWLEDEAGNRIDARDPLAVMSLGARHGAPITVHCDHPEIVSQIADYVAQDHD